MVKTTSAATPTLTMTETVSIDKVYKLLTAEYDLGDDVVRGLLKFIEGNGKVDVTYTHGKNKHTNEPNTSGRWFANCGLQSMSNEARYYLLGDDYVDLDFVNSNPKILLDYAINNGVSPSDYEYLKAYCNGGRELLIQQGLKGIKDWMRAMCMDPYRYDESWCEDKKRLACNVKSIVETLVKKFPKEYEEATEDVGSFMARLLFNKESILLQDLLDELKLKKVDVMTLCFDGCVVKKSPMISEVLKIWNEKHPSFECVVKPWRSYPNLKYINVQSWDYKDNVIFSYIYDSLGTVFESETKAFSYLYKHLLKTVRLIQGKTYVLKSNTESDFYLLAKSSAMKDVTFKLRGKNDSVLEVPIIKLIKMTPRLFNFDGLDYFKETPNNFCLFQGFVPDLQPMEIPPNYEEVVEPVLNHMFHCWSRGDQYFYDWLINYFAFLVQHYPKKSESILIFTGDEGTGKSMLLDFMMDKIFGHMAFTITGSDKLTRNFNSHLAGKIIICMEELRGTGDDYRHDSNRLKQLATGKWIDIERKGIDVIKILNTLNIIGFSNYPNPLGACRGIKRRIVIQEVSDIYKGDADYFRNLMKVLDDPITAHCLLKYLREVKVDMDMLRFNKPTTFAKSQSVFQALPVVEKCLYLYKVIQDDPSYNSTVDKVGFVRCENISELNARCFETKLTSNVIGKTLAQLKLTEKRSAGTRYRDYREYKFEDDILEVAKEEAQIMGLIEPPNCLLDETEL